MRKYLISILLAASLLAACTGNGSSPVPSIQPLTPEASNPGGVNTLTFEPPTPATPSFTPTSTLAPATPTATPATALLNGPSVIAYQTAGSLDKRLFLLDPADGTAVEFSFPSGAIFATPFLDGLSPGARYFVYYEGGRIEMYDQLVAEAPDFVMRVIDLGKKQVIFSTPLLSPEYPQNLKPLVELTTDQYWMQETDRSVMLEDLYSTMQQTMMASMRTVAWSPDGSLLAFASENPGPTSDMYYFDPARSEAWRVSGEPRNVFDLIWAPDSSAIALETTLYFTQATRITTDVLTRLGTTLRSIEPYAYFQGWFDPHKLLFSRFIDFGDPYFHLELISANSNEQTTLWEGSYENVAISSDLSSMMITSSQPNEQGESPGLYLIKSGTQNPVHLSESKFWKVAYWGSEDFSFAASAPDTGIFDEPQAGGTFGLSATGDLTLIDKGNWYLLSSPDARLLAAYGPYESIAGLRVFGADGKLRASISDSVITCIAWDPASDRLAYQVGRSLYLWSEGDNAGRLVAEQLEDDLDYQECGFTWVNLTP